jgi:hypothetical protein
LECGLLRIDNAWACERCNGVFIGEHLSAARCNATGNDVTLCHDCCEVANAEAVKQSAADHPAQPIVVASDGVVRFKCNPIVRWLLDAGPFDMNTIALKPEFTVEDRRQFAQLIGYSVSGYGDLSYGCEDPRLPEFDSTAAAVFEVAKP